jgi:hypothetical protein
VGSKDKQSDFSNKLVSKLLLFLKKGPSPKSYSIARSAFGGTAERPRVQARAQAVLPGHCGMRWRRPRKQGDRGLAMQRTPGLHCARDRGGAATARPTAKQEHRAQAWRPGRAFGTAGSSHADPRAWARVRRGHAAASPAGRKRPVTSQLGPRPPCA